MKKIATERQNFLYQVHGKKSYLMLIHKNEFGGLKARMEQCASYEKI